MPGEGAGSSGDNFEVDIPEGDLPVRAAKPSRLWHLHTQSGGRRRGRKHRPHLTADFYKYGINWVRAQSITCYLDGKQIGRMTSARLPIPDERMQSLISNSVANSNAAGCHTILNSSIPD